MLFCTTSHAPRERVSWNLWVKTQWMVLLVTLHVSVWVEIFCKISSEIGFASHAPRERVSWNVNDNGTKVIFRSHAPRERVSWNDIYEGMPACERSHAPRERVSWNMMADIDKAKLAVTLHVSVWVEISDIASCERMGRSRSTWACELKCTAESSTAATS